MRREHLLHIIVRPTPTYGKNTLILRGDGADNAAVNIPDQSGYRIGFCNWEYIEEWRRVVGVLGVVRSI